MLSFLMNRILAEAFRSKCMDIRASNSPGVLQDATQGYSGLRSSAALYRPLPPHGAPTGVFRHAVLHHSTPRPLSSSQLRTLNINSIYSPAATGSSTNHLHIDDQNRAPPPHLKVLDLQQHLWQRWRHQFPLLTSQVMQLPSQRVSHCPFHFDCPSPASASGSCKLCPAKQRSLLVQR